MAENEIKSINGRKLQDEKARQDIANISVPTKTSELENDSNFVTDTEVDDKIANIQIGSGNITFENVLTDEIFTSITESVLCTSISLNETVLTFDSNTTKTLTTTVLPSDCTESVTWGVNPTGIITIENGLVTPIKNGTATITATCGSQSATCSVTVDLPTVDLPEVYTVTYNLTNTTSSNNETSVNENESYTTNITANENYELKTVTVIMGGNDITSSVYADGVITISRVTGNIVITVKSISTISTTGKLSIENIDSQDYFVFNADNMYKYSSNISNVSSFFSKNKVYSNDNYELYNIGTPISSYLENNNQVISINGVINKSNTSSYNALLNDSSSGDLYTEYDNNTYIFRFPANIDNINTYIKEKYTGFKLPIKSTINKLEIDPECLTSINIKENNENSQYIQLNHNLTLSGNIYSGLNTLTVVTANNTNLSGVNNIPAVCISTNILSIKLRPNTIENLTLEGVKQYLTENQLIFFN